jgi:transcriptional regulator with XRE-family HTH domain
MQRTVIANLENGRRETLSVAELLILAAALDIPPTLLISAVGLEPTVNILPGVEETTWRTRGWILGALAPNYSMFSPKAWQQGRRAIELYDMHRLLVNECQQVIRRIRRLTGDRGLDVSDFPTLEGTAKLQRTDLIEVVLELSYSLDRLRTHRNHIRSEGYLAPEMPSSLAVMLRESEPSGRHHRQEPEVAPTGREPNESERLLPPIIHDLMRVVRDEPRSESGEP